MNGRQQRFCEEYAKAPDAKAAALAAGYSTSRAKETGCELLKRPDIRAEISRLRAIRDQEVGFSAADVVRELVAVAMIDIGDVLTWGMEEVEGEDGLPMTMPNGDPIMRPIIAPVASSKLTPVQRRAIKSVSMSEKGVFKVELHDRVKALDMLGRHFGIFERDNEQAGKAAAGTVAALVAAAQGKPLSPVTAGCDDE